MKIISHSFFILFLLFVIFSCKKIEPWTSKNPNFETDEQLKQNVDKHFFDYNYVSAFNFRLEEIHLRDLNSKEDIKTKQKSAIELYSPFIEEIRDFYRLNPAAQKNIEKKYGFPMWDRLVEVKLDDGELAVIPVANEESICIEAIIYVFKNKNGKLKFHYAERGKFDKYPVIAEKVNGKKYPDREFVISQFLYFDKAIFEYVDCDILDEYKDLTGINEDQLKSASTVECTVTIEQITYDYYYGVYVGGSLVKFAYNYTEFAYDVEYYCSGTYTYNPGGGNGTMPGGGGSTGDGPYEIPNLNRDSLIQVEICNAYSGIINVAYLGAYSPEFTPYQEQFIISLANLAAMYALGFSLEGLKNDLANYRISSNLYTKFNKLNNPEIYIADWDSAYN